jgi:hypothetical protein
MFANIYFAVLPTARGLAASARGLSVLIPEHRGWAGGRRSGDDLPEGQLPEDFGEWALRR